MLYPLDDSTRFLRKREGGVFPTDWARLQLQECFKCHRLYHLFRTNKYRVRLNGHYTVVRLDSRELLPAT